jgi:hypothetical protein
MNAQLFRVRTLKGKQEKNKDDDKIQLDGKKTEKEWKKKRKTAEAQR